MQGNEKLVVTMPNGESEQVEEVISFQFNDTKKRYVVYTKNEVDETGNITIYVSEIMKDTLGTKLLGVSSDTEWNKIKEALRKLANKE